MALAVTTVKILNHSGEMRNWSLFYEICGRGDHVYVDRHVRTLRLLSLSA